MKGFILFLIQLAGSLYGLITSILRVIDAFIRMGYV